MTKRSAASAITHVDNDLLRVTEWRFEDGAETGRHTHGLDYVVVPLGDGRLMVEPSSGDPIHAEMKKGAAYFRLAGTEHNVVNASGGDFAFVEIELKAG